jgi:hypothetical protein
MYYHPEAVNCRPLDLAATGVGGNMSKPANRRGAFAVPVLVGCAVLGMVSMSPAYAFRVLVHVGHDFTARELETAEGWTEVAERADGVWTFDAWIRTLETPTEQDAVLAHLKSREFCIAEFHWSPHFVGENRAVPNPVIDPCERAGFREIWCMTYDESRYGSTLSAEQVKRYRELYPDYKVITNFRVFDAERFAKELAALDGISYEFNVLGYGETRQHHPDQTKLENVVEAIRWCLDHNQLIVLLMPPGDDRPAEDDRFIEAMKNLIRDLDEVLEDKHFENENLILVPATYDCRKRGVHNTPEMEHGSYANTGMGATLAAIDYRDNSSFRESLEQDVE